MKSRVKSRKITKKNGKKWMKGPRRRKPSVGDGQGPPGEYSSMTRTLSGREQGNPMFRSPSKASVVEPTVQGKSEDTVDEEAAEEVAVDEGSRRTSKLEGSLGVSLTVLRDIVFHKDFKDSMTTAEVCKKFVLNEPSKKAKKNKNSKKNSKTTSSYAELQRGLGEEGEPPRTGIPTHFVSHAWGYKFEQLYDSLARFEAEGSNDDDSVTGTLEELSSNERVRNYYYIDVFCVNQQQQANHDHSFWATTFQNFVSAIGHTVLVMLPWQDPLPMKRAWCIYEIYCTISNGAKLTVTMTKEEHLNIEAALTKDDKLVKAFEAGPNIENAEATVAEDKENILKLIRDTIGVDHVNDLVRKEVCGILLCLAAGIGNDKVVKRLLKAGANPDVRVTSSTQGTSPPLFHAVAGGHLDVAKAMVELGMDPNVRNADNVTLVHSASFWGYTEILKWLLEELKLNPNIRERRQGWRPLHSACAQGHPKCVSLLLDNGARPIVRRADSLQPLHVACLHGYTGCIEELLKRAPPSQFFGKNARKVAPNGKGTASLLPDDLVMTRASSEPHGHTPLHCAMATIQERAIKRKPLMVKLLLGHDSECSKVGDNNGNTAWFTMRLESGAWGGLKGLAQVSSGEARFTSVDCDESVVENGVKLPDTLDELTSQLFKEMRDGGVDLKELGIGSKLLAGLAAETTDEVLTILEKQCGQNLDWKECTKNSSKKGKLNVFQETILSGNDKVALRIFDSMPDDEKTKLADSTFSWNGTKDTTHLHLCAASKPFRYYAFDEAVAEAILKHCSDASKLCAQVDSKGNTAFHKLSGVGKFEFVKLLSNHGLDANKLNKAGLTAMDVVIGDSDLNLQRISPFESHIPAIVSLQRVGGMTSDSTKVKKKKKKSTLGIAQQHLQMDPAKIKKSTVVALRKEADLCIKSRPLKSGVGFMQSVFGGHYKSEVFTFLVGAFTVLFSDCPLFKKENPEHVVIQGCFGSNGMGWAGIEPRADGNTGQFLTSTDFMNKITIEKLNNFQDMISDSKQDLGHMSTWNENERAIYFLLRYIYAHSAQRLLKEEL